MKMPTFSKISKDRLATCHDDLQRLFNEVIKHWDCTIVCGHRGKEDQDKAFADGKSKVKWPNGKHNKFPSLAVDVMPYPIDWNDTKRNFAFAGFVLGIATMMGISVRGGHDFDGDHNLNEGDSWDVPHWELKL